MTDVAVVGSIRPETDVAAISAWRRERKQIGAAAFHPKSHLTLSQWADKHRWLSADTGNGGRWRTDTVPYLRRPMDAITDPLVRKVTMMKSARIGATQAIVINTMFYCVDQDPCAIIVGLPTIDDALKFSSKLLQPAIDDTTVVAEKIAVARSRKRRSTMLERTYAGGSWQIIGTKSPRAARMVHGRVILKSEIDAWEGSAGSDGDPYNLIDKRAGSYDNPKFIEESTPLVRETSRIEPAFLAGSEEYYYVPCPHCREFQRLLWGGKEEYWGIKWGRKADGSPDLRDVYYVCQPNGCVIQETDKNQIVARGEWKANHPERTDHLSFQLNALVSPFDGARWPVLVDEWYKTERKPEKVRVFVNTVLGETYVEDGEQADGDTLTQRRDEESATWYDEGTPVPAGAAILTRSVDTQGDRLETAVWAWGEGEECWLVDYELLPGDPATAEPWNALDERIGYATVGGRLVAAEPKAYKHASGRMLTPRVTFIDAGGHHSKQVKGYSRRRIARRVYAIFGATLQRAPILGNPTRVGRVIQYPIGVFAAKESLIKRIEKIEEPGPGFIHLPPWTTDEHIEQLTAEKMIAIGEKRVFKKTRARNEMTDLWVYSLAALYRLGAKTVDSLGRMATQLMATAPNTAQADEPAAAIPSPPPSPPAAKRAPRRRPGGGFVNRWR